MKQFDVTGMMCAACSARVEKAVNEVPGVTSCSVNLLTNSMGVEGTATDEQIIQAVTDAGYGASPKQSESKSLASPADDEPLKDRETPVLVKRLIASIIFLLPLMIIAMASTGLSWEISAFIQLGLAAFVLIINRKFFINGFKGFIHLAPNMDSLVAMGSGVSFIYSTWIVISGDPQHLYFESAAMILTLITVGKMLEARSKGKTTNALKGLMKLAPKTAVIIAEDKEKTVPIEQVRPDDIFVVRPGENIPVDGIIIEGNATINEAALTGESIPIDKKEGDTVSAATTNTSSFIKCRATRVGQDTTLSQIIRMVSDASASKAPIAKIADKVSGVFVPTVIAISLVTLGIWLAVGAAAETAIMHAVAVLVISCPCALGLATPVAIMVGNGVGARNGILFKTAESLEQAGKTTIAVLDKTGTITTGTPAVTDIIPFDESDLLSLAYSVEIKSEHPLAKAIIHAAEEKGLEASPTSDFKILAGNGVQAKLEQATLYGGSLNFIKTKCTITPQAQLKYDELSAQGKTPLFFAKDGTLIGIIAVADQLKADSAQAVKELEKLGIKTVMLTGDNERTAKAIAAQAGIKQVIAGVLPDQKAQTISRLKEQGKVCMVGDGINDAPSLTIADTGIAIGAGSDIAIDSADIVLMKNSLLQLPALIRLSRATVRNIKQNLFWAFFYNVLCIPLAAGAFVPLLGWHLNPMFGAAAMSLSSFCVVMNALRLNAFKN
ncbi:MAG: copper-translocating P-type ATPase [Treponema sp.]|nr:copper-translocating P-type ATPase [Treponema sp.]